MKIAIVGVLGLFLAVSPAFAADEGAEKTISRSFAVEPGGEVNVDADEGDIQVLTGDQNTVEVVVEREVIGGSAGQATSLLKSHKVAITQDGNEVRVQSAMPKPGGFSLRSKPNLSVHFRITTVIPVALTVEGKLKEGKLEGKLNGGGPVLALRTSGGDIQVLKK